MLKNVQLLIFHGKRAVLWNSVHSSHHKHTLAEHSCLELSEALELLDCAIVVNHPLMPLNTCF